MGSIGTLKNYPIMKYIVRKIHSKFGKLSQPLFFYLFYSLALPPPVHFVGEALGIS